MNSVTLDANHIRRLGELARLAIEPDEIADVATKLTDIVALVDQLQAVDTAAVKPMAHPLDRTQPLREDLVTEQDEHAVYQQNAPLVERDLYLVPKVID